MLLQQNPVSLDAYDHNLHPRKNYTKEIGLRGRFEPSLVTRIRLIKAIDCICCMGA